MLTLVESKREIATCQRLMEGELRRHLQRGVSRTVGHPGGSFRNTIYFGVDLWFSTQTLRRPTEPSPRYWNGFGLGERPTGHQIIIVEINPPIQGKNARISGAFGRDNSTGRHYLLHRGRVGGGRKGIGKEAFRSWYRGRWIELHADDGSVDDAVLVGELGRDKLWNPLRAFVKEVSEFKEGAAEQARTRQPPAGVKLFAFSPEAFGKRLRRTVRHLEFESRHGEVVNALASQLQANTPGARTFNTRLVDLGVVRKGKVVALYEVKSTTTPQSIYTGLGQLMLHSKGDPLIEKTLVLPERLGPEVRRVLKQLGIGTLQYRIKRREISFET